jgi:hypothetical protein
MKTTQITRIIATGFLGLYTLWALFTIGVIGLLFTGSVGLIVFGMYDDQIEVATASTILTGLVFYLLMRWTRKTEGFAANDLSIIKPAGPEYPPGQYGESSGEYLTDGAAVTDSPVSIAQRIAKISKQPVPQEIKGMLSSKMTEGFADASVVDSAIPDAGSERADKKRGMELAAPNSDQPAPLKNADEINAALVRDMPKPSKNAEFRLGSIPTDLPDGPHIDAASTLMNALNALKPEQVQSMTEDTRKLMETQKNLMGMMQTMQPLLKDGKNLLEQFGTMFAK